MSPTENHWVIVRRVFIWYLKCNERMCLRYTGETESLETFSDASFAKCKISPTTCGYGIKIFEDSMCWCTHEQSYVALSICEVEYITSEASQK